MKYHNNIKQHHNIKQQPHSWNRKYLKWMLLKQTKNENISKTAMEHLARTLLNATISLSVYQCRNQHALNERTVSKLCWIILLYTRNSLVWKPEPRVFLSIWCMLISCIVITCMHCLNRTLLNLVCIYGGS